MTLNLTVPQNEVQLKPRITVIGVGGAGGNAVNNMIQSNLEGVEFVITNTDAQAINQSLCDRRVQLGKNITQGLGAGSRPDVGRAAAEETLDEILEHIEGSNMIFVTAGMGGGTGTGAAPVIARAAREKGILTVGVITKPFHFEGVHRMRMAENGIEELTQYVDTLIIIPNQNLFRVANDKTTFADAFKMADDVLHSGVRGVTDLMVMPGLINLDFADIRSVMTEMGKAMMGTGEAEGENRSIAAAEAAISNPLLDDVSMKGARGVLINITGGADMTLFEVDEAANRIRDEVDPEANIIFGSTFDEDLHGTMRISVVATGIDANEAERPKAVPLAVVSSRGAQEREMPKVAEPEIAAAAVARADAEKTAAEANGLGAEEKADAAERTAPEPAVAKAKDDENEEREAEERLIAAVETDDDEEEAATEQTDSFIPPPPVEAEPTISERPTRRATTQSDPFAEAAMTNAASQERSVRMGLSGGEQSENKPRSRAHQLFSRVTGGGRIRQDDEPVQEAKPARESERTAAPRGEPRVVASQAKQEPDSRPQPRSAPASGGSSSSAAAQPRLTGLEPRDRAPSSQQDEDLLDIPAFLRRQAN
jgi:cell division protein FtsZ